MVNPLINYGQVKHSRLRPVSNRFSYGVFTLKIPMRERNRNPNLLKQFGVGDNRWAFYSFYDHDHGQGTKTAWNGRNLFLPKRAFQSPKVKSGCKHFQEYWVTFSIQSAFGSTLMHIALYERS